MARFPKPCSSGRNKNLRKSRDIILWDEIIAIINNHQHFVITSHQNPDGDAIGSELGLAGHLRKLGKKVKIINHDPLPPSYRFMGRKRWVKRFSKSKHSKVIAEAEVIIVVDASGGWKRTGNVGEFCEKSTAIKVCIDHHPDTADFADVAVIDTNAAAAAELIYDLLVTMKADFSKQMATALYTAILTDTGNFRFPKTSPHTHEIAAKLIEYGADPFQAYKMIYEQSTPNRVKLKGQVLANLNFAAEGQIVYFGITHAMLDACEVKTSELEGFASLGQEIKGVRVIVYGLELGDGRVKLSLRSDDTVAVNKITAEYGGGGHHGAAGATTQGKLKTILAEVVQKVIALMATQLPAETEPSR